MRARAPSAGHPPARSRADARQPADGLRCACGRPSRPSARARARRRPPARPRAWATAARPRAGTRRPPAHARAEARRACAARLLPGSQHEGRPAAFDHVSLTPLRWSTYRDAPDQTHQQFYTPAPRAGATSAIHARAYSPPKVAQGRRGTWVAPADQSSRTCSTTGPRQARLKPLVLLLAAQPPRALCPPRRARQQDICITGVGKKSLPCWIERDNPQRWAAPC